MAPRCNKHCNKPKPFERDVVAVLKTPEVRATAVYAGMQQTETSPQNGSNLGQVVVSLNPHTEGMRSIEAMADAVMARVTAQHPNIIIKPFVIKDGPPLTRPINLKARGTDFETIQTVVNRMRAYMETQREYRNISVDFRLGNPELQLSLNGDAIQRAGLKPADVSRVISTNVDGELLSRYQYLGEEVDVRLRTRHEHQSLETLLEQPVVNPQGQAVPLGELVEARYTQGYQNIYHYNFLRTITIEADIDESRTNTVLANQKLLEHWQPSAMNTRLSALIPAARLMTYWKVSTALPVCLLLASA